MLYTVKTSSIVMGQYLPDLSAPPQHADERGSCDDGERKEKVGEKSEPLSDRSQTTSTLKIHQAEKERVKE